MGFCQGFVGFCQGCVGCAKGCFMFSVGVCWWFCGVLLVLFWGSAGLFVGLVRVCDFLR